MFRTYFPRRQPQRQGPSRHSRRFRPLVEALEERWVPSNWFVSMLGSDNNPGTPATPFASIQHAVNVAQSGDRIHVAQGTYGYVGADRIADDARFGSPGNTGTLSGSFLHVNPAVVLLFDKSLQIYGGFDNAFTTWAPSTYRTYIDGGAVNRGVYVLDDNGAAGLAFAKPASLDMEGFTIEACKATGEAGLPAPDNGNAYGAGMWINTVARLGDTQYGSRLKNVVFRGNYARGNDANVVGGSAAGAALALRGVVSVALDGVTFDSNLSQGGSTTQGSTSALRGGSAQGAVFLDRSMIFTDGTLGITFYNNRAVAGLTSGAGQDSAGKTADATGGGLAMSGGAATLQNVVALNNSVTGGGSANFMGAAYGGSIYAENSTLNLLNADIRGDVVQTGRGSAGSTSDTAGPAGGGGIAAVNSTVNLNQVQVINNSVVLGAVSGGGGMWLARAGTVSAIVAQIYNCVIADNMVASVSPITRQSGAGGGGLLLQGVEATLLHTTIANNHFDNNAFDGQAILLTPGTTSRLSPAAATAVIADSIIANHTNTTGAAALHTNGDSLTATLDRVLYANNTKNDNSDNQPGPSGIFNGLNTVIHAASVGFTSPGAPNEDYSIAANSPAVGQAAANTAKTDIEGNPFTTPDLGAYAAPAPPRARSSVGLFDPETGIWQLRNSNAGGFFPDGPVFAYGSGGGHSKPVVGDWTGNGTSTVGVVEVKTLDFNGKPFLTDANGNAIPVSVFELRNTNSPGTPDILVPYGSASAMPVAGNWDNNPQHIDHIGVVEIQNGAAVWKLRNDFTRGAPDITIAYGGPTSIPVVGDWNGDGTSTLGVVENVGGLLTWKLRNSFTPGAPDAGSFAYGLASQVPISGDWNNDKTFTPGVYSFANGLWQLRNENSFGPADAGVFAFGPSGGANPYAEPLIPLAGDFDGLA